MTMKIIIFWDVMLCSWSVGISVSEDPPATILTVGESRSFNLFASHA